MKHVSITNNIVFVFNRTVYDDFNTQEIEEKIKIVYSSQDPQVGSTNFPNEIKAVFSTNLQLQVVGQQKSLVVADTKINATNEFNNPDIIKLALNIQRLMSEKSLVTRFFGFNFVFTFQEVDFSDIQEKIKKKYFKTSAISPEKSLQFFLPNMSYEKDSARYSYKFDVEVDEDSKPSKVNVACNVHFSDVSLLKDDGSFLELYKNSYKHIYEFLGDV